MHFAQIDSLPWEEKRSPSGKFHSFCRDLSLATGGLRNLGPSHGGHPFDVQIRRIPAGASICPFHSHLAQSEFFLIQSGHGLVRAGDQRVSVKTGDYYFHPPGEAHQLFSIGPGDLHVLIVTDNPELDGFYYPDSDKWGLRPPGNYFHITPTGYFTGEDDEPNGAAEVYRPPQSVMAQPTPFSTRLRALANTPWLTWESPKKKYRGAGQQLSEELGARRNTPTGLGGHPFDVELGKLLPGECGCVFHAHLAQSEFYIFLTGHGTVRTLEGLHPVHAGDVVLHPPGEAHQFTNTGDTDLHYLLVADNPRVDVCHYPDSDKYNYKPNGKNFRMIEVDYHDGEE